MNPVYLGILDENGHKDKLTEDIFAKLSCASISGR